MTHRHTAAGMWYRTYGHGRRDTYLLVHGWAGDHRFMVPLARHLATGRSRAIVVDMPGHGQSPPPPEGYGVPEMAARLRAFAAELDLCDVTIVGHSLGGVWSLEAAAGDRDRFTGLALLDSAVAGPPGSAEGIAQVAASLRDDTTGQVRESIVRAYFLPRSDPRLVERVVEAMAEPSTEVAYAPIAALAAYVAADADAAALARWDRPLLFVGSNSPYADYARLAQLAPQVSIGQTVGSGHFVQLEVPRQIDAMLDRFLEITD
ncbi:Pimeloyl-ACP methyl ester carboxylesterase [Micromonospora nigra]|uniref:Pimeloyl-ACP methyl ester carboxylesterase n=1 Tax=Micromonospora nigra TaxID=145857 RepID=A0A1C6T133_9ACTN|nr:alpha/beta fold hydrolase [Micromonospora nigra]SCL35055.1 Pimeloyl-ACP methyl ester carboxylesterase [Micromonospora nigra]